jgi:hypothetical protein
MDIISRIHTQLNLHDVPLDTLTFDFPGEKIVIHYSSYQEGTNSYIGKILRFTGVNQVLLGSDFLMDINEITNVDIAKADEGYTADILFLAGPGDPSWNLKFYFREFHED